MFKNLFNNEEKDEIKDETLVESEDTVEELVEEIVENDENTTEIEDVTSDLLDETSEEEENTSNKFIVGVIGQKLSDNQKEVIKSTVEKMAAFNKGLGYTDIEVIELSENEEENEGIHVDVKIDKTKPLPKFVDSGIGMAIGSKYIPDDMKYLFGSGKNRKATKKKRRK